MSDLGASQQVVQVFVGCDAEFDWMHAKAVAGLAFLLAEDDQGWSTTIA